MKYFTGHISIQTKFPAAAVSTGLDKKNNPYSRSTGTRQDCDFESMTALEYYISNMYPLLYLNKQIILHFGVL